MRKKSEILLKYPKTGDIMISVIRNTSHASAERQGI